MKPGAWFGAVRPEVMMVSVTRTLKRWVTELARRMGVDANPLRRGCDRAEGWVRLGLVVVFLVASPLAAMPATAAVVTTTATPWRRASRRRVARRR